MTLLVEYTIAGGLMALVLVLHAEFVARSASTKYMLRVFACFCVAGGYFSLLIAGSVYGAGQVPKKAIAVFLLTSGLALAIHLVRNRKMVYPPKRRRPF